ncbi:Anti-sigma-K factor rskA [Modestobacter sp. DSM 44400]|uniref:anti-sigma factor n=1 Tax=Modestobacter sp. DSM 44400 TaxID=1550230 RepID=UPI000895EA24|nr:anti-sigma factor [Modestobacter sp. DSM 44400]SDX62360.1 Anti-sigma-K factor rskA [Modestobacter sp. DSM 44400]
MTGHTRRHDDHEAFDELAVGWALHALEPEDEDAFAAHLARCDRCARTVAETHDVMAALAADLPLAEPSEGLRDRLRAAVEKTEQLPSAAVSPELPRREVSPVRPVERAAARHPAGGVRPAVFDELHPPRSTRVPDPRPAWRRIVPHALVAAAVAAVLALGAWNVVLAGDRDAIRATAAEQSEMLDALLTSGRATIAPLTDQGRAVATVVARPDEVQVVAAGLPVNDTQDTTYVVWGMRNGVPEALGTFDVVSPERQLRTVGSTPTGLDDYASYAISIEPGRQAPSYPTDVVARGEVAS